MIDIVPTMFLVALAWLHEPRHAVTLIPCQKGALTRGQWPPTHESKNVQHQAFPDGHPPEYYSDDYWFVYGRADGIPNTPVSMAVRGGMGE